MMRSALQQAVRWEGIATNPASSAPIESPKRQQQQTLTNDEVRAVIVAAAEAHELASPAFRLAVDPPNPDRIGWWWRHSREPAGTDPRWRLHDRRHWSTTEAIASGQDVRTVSVTLIRR